MSWLVSVPVWGKGYMAVFAGAPAQALQTAAQRLRRPIKFVVHTDLPDAARAALAGCDVEVRAVAGKPTYVALQESHADAVARAAPGDCVVLLNADLVVSGNFLLSCAQHVDEGGRQAVVLLGIRTVIGLTQPPVGAAPRELLAWGWEHRHQIIRDLEWPAGGSMLPTNLFFACGGSVVARGFHLHPACIVRREDTVFSSTIDGDLLDCYPREAVHVVVDPDDCAMVEMSPPERRFPVRGTHMNPAVVAASMRTRASATHRWLFGHRIGVCGSPGEVVEDEPIAAEILRQLEGTPPARYGGGTPTPRTAAGRRLLRGREPVRR